MMFVSSGTEDRFHVKAGRKNIISSTRAQTQDWYEKTGDERDAMIEENFMVGKKFPEHQDPHDARVRV